MTDRLKALPDTSSPRTDNPMNEALNPRSGKICPLVKTPHATCHCANLTSSSAEAAIYFCGGHFNECDIYSRYSGQLKTVTKNKNPLPQGKGVDHDDFR
ncbi:hypothetical protein AOP6_2500 [Desulfuromonas sp. AOP6]|nr:hypothetical protein AOP6_2500 [Desulfuromonas sp. AOP6]